MRIFRFCAVFYSAFIFCNCSLVGADEIEYETIHQGKGAAVRSGPEVMNAIVDTWLKYKSKDNVSNDIKEIAQVAIKDRGSRYIVVEVIGRGVLNNERERLFGYTDVYLVGEGRTVSEAMRRFDGQNLYENDRYKPVEYSKRILVDTTNPSLWSVGNEARVREQQELEAARQKADKDAADRAAAAKAAQEKADAERIAAQRAATERAEADKKREAQRREEEERKKREEDHKAETERNLREWASREASEQNRKDGERRARDVEQAGKVSATAFYTKEYIEKHPEIFDNPKGPHISAFQGNDGRGELLILARPGSALERSAVRNGFAPIGTTFSGP